MNRTLAQKLKLAALSAVCALAVGCGGGDGGDDDDVGGGGGGNPPSVNLTSTWNVVEQSRSNCGNDDELRYQVQVTQNGSSVSVAIKGGTLTGSLNGNTLQLSGSYPENGGTARISSLTGTLSSDGNTINSHSIWTWSGGGDNCNGTADSVLTRR
jgi:hypothetical protein